MNDVAVNSVSEENKVEVVAEIKPATAVSAPPTSSVQITGITAGSSSSSALPNQDDPTPFKPQRVGSMFARFIDDIFQVKLKWLKLKRHLDVKIFVPEDILEIWYCRCIIVFYNCVFCFNIHLCSTNVL